jgi:hypothetical protein
VWSIADGALAAATYSYTAIQTDVAGNASAASGALSVTIDTSAPAAPAVTAITTDTGSSGTDEITNDTTLTISGTGENGATVTLTRDGVTTVGTGTVAGGVWSIADGALAAASYSYTAIQTDPAGNASAASGALSVTIDTTADAAPAVTAISTDTGSSATDEITSDTTLTISGTGVNGSTVTLTRDGVTTVGTGTVAGGVWSIADGALAAASYSYTAIQTDPAGNASAASGALAVVIDTSAPAAPAVTAISDDNGSSATDEITSDQNLILSGTGENGATVSLTRVGTGVIGSATVAGGVWSVDYTATTLPEAGYSFTATQTDVAGNSSAASAALAVIVDIGPPVAPVLTGITTDSGSSATDEITNDNMLMINGTAEASATVTVTHVGTGILGSVAADGSGNWSYNHTAVPLADGSHSFTATQTDLGGNTGPASTALVVTVDTAAAAPVIAGISTDSGSSATDEVTNDTTLFISGTGEIGATVALTRVGTGVIGSPTVDGSGNWSYDYTGTTLAQASHSFTATQTDIAGTTSAATVAFAVTVDTAAPAQPVITYPGNDATTDGTPDFAGTSEANATVSIFSDGNLVDTATANGAGSWSFSPSTELMIGTQTITVTATDLAGNESVASADLIIKVGVPAGTYIVDNGDPGYSEPTAIWNNSASPGFANSTSRSSTSATATASWDVTVPAGWYEVSIYKIKSGSSPTEMAVDIDHDDGTTTKTVDCTENASGWVILGTYHVTSGTGTVTISQPTAATLRADAVRFITSAEVIVDNGDAGYAENGVGWVNSSVGFQGLLSRRTSGAGSAGASADYTATGLQAGEEYSVFVYRVVKSSNSSNVNITVGTNAGTVVKNTSLQSPDAVNGWYYAGTHVMAATSVVTIERDSASSTAGLQVDAVRWERTGQYSTGTTDSGYVEQVGVWTDDAGAGFMGEDARISSTAGAKVRWKTSLMKGTYKVYIWRMQSGAPAKVQIALTGSDGSINVNTDVDFSSAVATEQWILLGTYAFNTGIGQVTMTKDGGANPLRASRVVYVPTKLPKEIGAGPLSDKKPALPVGNG